MQRTVVNVTTPTPNAPTSPSRRRSQWLLIIRMFLVLLMSDDIKLMDPLLPRRMGL